MSFIVMLRQYYESIGVAQKPEQIIKKADNLQSFLLFSLWYCYHFFRFPAQESRELLKSLKKIRKE
jgi:hypothetical protein